MKKAIFLLLLILVFNSVSGQSLLSINTSIASRFNGGLNTEEAENIRDNRDGHIDFNKYLSSRSVSGSAAEMTYVPDDNFEQALIDLGYDDVLDDYVSTREISQIEKLNISDKNIETLSGLEGFVSLQHLYCSENKITELDLSYNPDIVNLFIEQNLISSLDLSPLGSILFFSTRDNPLTCIQVNEMQLERSDNLGLMIWLYDEGVTLSLDCSD